MSIPPTRDTAQRSVHRQDLQTFEESQGVTKGRGVTKGQQMKELTPEEVELAETRG